VAAVRRDPLVSWLLSLLSELGRRTRAEEVGDVVAQMRQRAAAVPAGEPGEGETGPLIRVLVEQAVALAGELAEERAAFQQFSDRYAAAGTKRARRRLLRERLRATARGRRLRGDVRALRRDLDHAALAERSARRAADLGRRAGLCLTLASRITRSRDSGSPSIDTASLLALTRAVEPDAPRAAALTLLGDLAGDAPGVPERLADVAGLRTAPLADQRAALGALVRGAPGPGHAVLRARLSDLPADLPGDDFLVRVCAVDLAAGELPAADALILLGAARSDPSEHVRTARLRALNTLVDAAALAEVRAAAAGGASPDPCGRVRATACELLAGRALDALGAEPAAAHPALEGVLGALEAETDALAQRVALDSAARCMARLAGSTDEWCSSWASALLAAMAGRARGEGCDMPVATRAAAHLVDLRPTLDDRFASLNPERLAGLARLTPGRRQRVARGTAELDTWGEALASAGQRGFGLSARPGRGSVVVQHGDRRRRSLARLLHEVRHRAPDKRQGGDHSALSTHLGTLRAPPLGLGAITSAGVPAEPVVAAQMGSWGPHLPTVTDCLDAARTGRALRLYHPHGVTVLRPPRWPRRVGATWALRVALARYDDLRQRSLEARDAPQRLAFVRGLQQLGFAVEWQPGEVECGGEHFSLDHPRIGQFFGPRSGAAAVAGLPSLSELADQAWAYTYSGAGNSLLQLAAFLGGLGTVVVGDAVWQAFRIRRWRRRVPLVIGGSGTRGKSGTERLKAALFHAQGCEVLCKTTGNEAMVIHSAPGLPPRELLLYRPYDKATIWEQRDVLRTGAQMGVQVLLWECMALNPRYVEILALEWMRDDLSTITNCYPDHEDVQGPAGRDVAASLGRFVPRKGVLLTSEREMTPILREQARQRASRCVEIDDLAGDRLPADLLARFPYREHPRNIALVARLAEEMGIDRWTAIEQMADHLVPDIGALKVFPTVSFRGRRITYVNGHSANDRTGFLNNWERTGLASFDPAARPGEWVAAVVNNRADRIARSRAFAAIVARDVSAHMLCLIGTNLGGFVGYLRDALHAELATFALGPDRDVARQRLGRLVARLQLPGWTADALLTEVGSWLRGCGLGAADVQARLEQSGLAAAVARHLTAGNLAGPRRRFKAWLRAGERDPALRKAVRALCAGATGDAREAELRAFVQRQVAIVAAVAAAARAVEDAADPDAVSRPLVRLFVDLVLERTRRLRDAKATGDQVLDFVCSQLPPGAHVHVMGMQNIKGTGLDFVYRWISLEQVSERVHQLGSSGPADAQRLLRWLRDHPDYGVLDARLALAAVQQYAAGQPEGECRAEAAATAKQLRGVAHAREQALRTGRRRFSPLGAVLRLVENALDYLHSIHRRRASRRVFDDLVHRRISHAQAASRLRELTSVQKGGWLSHRK